MTLLRQIGFGLRLNFDSTCRRAGSGQRIEDTGVTISDFDRRPVAGSDVKLFCNGQDSILVFQIKVKTDLTTR